MAAIGRIAYRLSMTRYALLREAIAYFASSAEVQLAHDWGADDAVDDTPYPLEAMLEGGELTPAENDIVRSFEEMVADYCSKEGAKPWHNEALLFSDPLWAQIRCTAAKVLDQLPDERRETSQSLG